jgi:hypothetical protein
MLPTGDLIFVRVQAEQAVTIDRAAGPTDVGPGDRVAPIAGAFQLAEFTQTVGGVVASVRQALDDHRSDSLTVEFGIEIVARAGALLSVLAEVGALPMSKSQPLGIGVMLQCLRPAGRS